MALGSLTSCGPSSTSTFNGSRPTGTRAREIPTLACQSRSLLIDWGLLFELDMTSGGRPYGVDPTGPPLCSTVRSAAVLVWDALSVVIAM